MNTDYWLGFATPIATASAGYALLRVVATICVNLREHDWFMEIGRPPQSKVDAWSRLRVRGRFGFYYGLYESTAGWGSHWVAAGPVTVGRRYAHLGLTEKPAASERTD